MNRSEFKKFAIENLQQPDDNNRWEDIIQHEMEPFWIPEKRDGWHAKYFIETIVVGQRSSRDPFDLGFWHWCEKYMSKTPLCFMSDSRNNKEWWGFNNEEDATLFILKWS